jgi:ketosteroid isomerase-like protein
MAKAACGIFDVWEDYRAEVEEIRESDETRVLVVHRRRGRGKSSGIDLDALQSKGATVFKICDGRVMRLTAYFDQAHALAHLGLTAGDESP